MCSFLFMFIGGDRFKMSRSCSESATLLQSYFLRAKRPQEGS